jgi:iron complex outermembrane receptor protein
VYNNTANALFTAGALGNGRNVSADVPGSGESRLNAPDVSTRFLEKADFVRLQNITLGYNLALKSKMISSVRFYINGQNLFVISGYSGQDPEVSTNKAIDGVPSAGIDYSAYPRARTFTFGANIRF